MNPSSRGRRADVLDMLARARPDSLDADPTAAIPAAIFTSASVPQAPAQPQRQRREPRRGIRLAGVGVAVTAAAAALSIAVTTALSPAGPPRPPGLSGSPQQPRHVVLTARSLLLAAAEHVARSPATGRYWQVRQEEVQVVGAGTLAHPYDMAIPTVSDTWLSPVAGRREFYYSRQLGARPATAADAAAWRAAGSPRSWAYGGKVAFATSPSAPEETWQYGHGKVGYLEGDLPYLSLRQFRELPATPGALAAALRREAMGTYSAQHPGGGGATAEQLIWDEALQVLSDPVSGQVRAAAFRVMARLAGVRVLGPMRDPMGRQGYGFGTGHTALGEIAIIDPATGSLLAYEYPGPPGGLTPAQARKARHRATAPGYLGLFVRRAHATAWSDSTCLLVTGWTNNPPGFAGTARHFPALAGY